MCNVGAGSGPAWRVLRGARSVPGKAPGGSVLQYSGVSRNVWLVPKQRAPVRLSPAWAFTVQENGVTVAYGGPLLAVTSPLQALSLWRPECGGVLTSCWAF